MKMRYMIMAMQLYTKKLDFDIFSSLVSVNFCSSEDRYYINISLYLFIINIFPLTLLVLYPTVMLCNLQILVNCVALLYSELKLWVSL